MILPLGEEVAFMVRCSIDDMIRVGCWKKAKKRAAMIDGLWHEKIEIRMIGGGGKDTREVKQRLVMVYVLRREDRWRWRPIVFVFMQIFCANVLIWRICAIIWGSRQFCKFYGHMWAFLWNSLKLIHNILRSVMIDLTLLHQIVHK